MKQSFAAITTALTLLTSFNLFASVSGVATNYTFTFDSKLQIQNTNTKPTFLFTSFFFNFH